MINLEELERKIDALLESETAESLTQWLKNNKSNQIDCYVDVGGIGGTYTDLDISWDMTEMTIITPKTTASDNSDDTYTNPVGYGKGA